MTASAGEREMMRDELSAIAGPILHKIKEHPFWDGLRKGTLPAASLWYFAEQDARHVVPTYARALARCAALAEHDSHGALLSSASGATFGSLSRLDSELTKLAEALGKPPGAGAITPAPPIHAYTSFMMAAPGASFAGGIGGLLPMTWFHLEVSTDLTERYEPGSLYAAWIDQYVPEGGYYQEYVDTYLNMIDEVGGQCSPGERDRLVEQFRLGARHEWAFADAAWRRQEWPV